MGCDLLPEEELGEVKDATVVLKNGRTARPGGPVLKEFVVVGMGIVGRISPWYFPEKYREAEGAAGSVLEPGAWA